MRILELFSGTGSVGAVFEARGHHVVSLDCDPKSDATIICDILQWDYRAYQPGSFDFIWGSPPCTMYSRCRTKAKLPRDLEGADRFVAKTLEIIEYLKPKWWMMENPQTGLLKTRDVVRGLPYAVVDYCQYGRSYRKPTQLWNNLGDLWTPRPRCNKQTCHAVEGNRHKQVVQNGPKTLKDGQTLQGMPLAMRYAIPQQLVEEICSAMEGR